MKKKKKKQRGGGNFKSDSSRSDGLSIGGIDRIAERKD